LDPELFFYQMVCNLKGHWHDIFAGYFHQSISPSALLPIPKPFEIVSKFAEIFEFKADPVVWDVATPTGSAFSPS
jgi:hypothetical protein